MPFPRIMPDIAWRKVFAAVLNPQPDPALDEAIAAKARDQAPVVWLLGKVQSGKTAIVRAITGAVEAEVGAAFKPCTQRSRLYEFPKDVPVVRFLDTRGLGEVAYDPTEDLALVKGSAHVVVAVARALDPQQAAILEVLHAARRRHPDWAVVLVQTRLHDGYPDDRDHPPYHELAEAPGLDDLRRALKVQASEFRRLPGKGMFRSVAVDLTRPEDQFSDPHYGLEALLDALDEACSEGRATLIRDLGRAIRDDRLARAHPHLLGYATAAGVSDLIPLMGFVTVPTLQGKMLHSIAAIYGIEWDRRTLKEFVTSLGTGAVLGGGARFTVQQFMKLIPVYGQVAGAAAAGVASASLTYALGRAACYYLEQARLGRYDPAGVASTYRGALKDAYAKFYRRSVGGFQAGNDAPGAGP